ncbi:MAG: site-2 protease family protein [Myxococcota bacterium]
MELIFKVILYYIPLLLSITIHEYAHAFTSYKLGDETAYRMGRLTLNPIAHIDILGTVIMPIMGILSGLPFFGWAKPVPFNPLFFNRNISMRRGIMYTALAGPVSNLIFALIMILCGRLILLAVPDSDSGIFKALFLLVVNTMQVNIGLFLFNLLPVPPLDGSKILYGILPESKMYIIEFIEKYSFILFIAVILFAGDIIGPAFIGMTRFFSGLMGIYF